MSKELTQAWSMSQNKLLSQYKPVKPEMPSDYACVDCETPVPPAGSQGRQPIPAGSVIEAFCSGDSLLWPIIVLLGTAAVLYSIHRRRR
jgi:hypothetical protein